MSRFPFGLCLFLLCQGCASMFTQASPAVRLGQSTRAWPSHPKQSEPAGQNSHVAPVGGDVSPSNITAAKPGPAYRSYPNGPVIQLGQAWPLLTPPQPQLRQPSAQPPLKPQILATPASAPDPMVNIIGAASPVWQRELKSTAGRPIEISQFGQGPLRVLVLGSLYGNEPESIQLIDAFARDLMTQRASQVATLLVIRTPNPDGLAEHMRTNQNGVDLNRNFPSIWFTAHPDRLTGPHAGSEIETQHLLQVLSEFQPDRVIHIRSSIGVRPLVLFNSRAVDVRRNMAQFSDIDSGTFGGQYKSGSFEEYVSLTAKLDLLTVQLPTEGFPQLDAHDLLTLACLPLVKVSGVPFVQPAKPGNPSQPSVTLEIPPYPHRPSLPDGEKGFVQLLPPPPEPEQINNTSSGGSRFAPEYFELSPPSK